MGSAIELVFLQMPDVAVIVFDGAVAREEAGVCDIAGSGFCPSLLVRIHRLDLLAGLAIGGVIGKDEELVVAVHDFVEDHAEAVLVALAPRAEEEGVKNLFDLGVFVVDVPRGIGAFLDHLFDFVGLKPKDDFVFHPSALGDFDVGPV